ncbi:hypothetical protein Tco_0270730 [Tanacetum coccineum]
MFDLKGKIIGICNLSVNLTALKVIQICLWVRRLGMLKAYDKKFEASHKFRLEIFLETVRAAWSKPVLGYDQFCDSDVEVRFQKKPSFYVKKSVERSSGLDNAPSTITSQKPTERELDLLFEAMYNDYIGGQPSAAIKTAPVAQAPQDVDELELEQQHVQQQDDQAPLQSKTVVDNVPNAMSDGDVFGNPFAPPSISAAESSSSQYVDLSNMHTFYQPYPYEYQWTKDHPLEQVTGEPS